MTAGPTREPIDAVRFLSNYSTGYMGALLAAEALRRHHRVTVICGPASESMPRGARVLPVEQAREMAGALRREARMADVVIMAAAVADYAPRRRVAGKIRRAGGLTLQLRAIPDIIARLPRRRGQVVAGFALETVRVVTRGRAKLQRKRLDLILAQQVPPPKSSVGGQAGVSRGGPFGRRTIRAWLLGRRGFVLPMGTVSKSTAARALLDKIESLWYGQQGHGTSS